jgi:putative endonuclease
MPEQSRPFFFYILRCADGAYYVGSTAELTARVDTHNAGRGPRYTARRRPVTLVYSERFDTMDQARRREIQVKKWSRAKKDALMPGDKHLLHELSRRRIR